MATTVPEITVVDVPLPAENQDGIAAPAAGEISSIIRGLFARRILVSSVLTRFYDYNALVWLDVWRANFGYLLPIVIIETDETIWNLMLVVVSVVILIWSAASKERNNASPLRFWNNVSVLRVWISVYMLIGVVHVVLLWKEYYRRRNSTDAVPIQISTYRRWEMTNTVSYWWSAIGINLMAANFHSKILLHDAPRLFWLTLGFLASSELFLALLMGCFCSMVQLIFNSFGKARYIEDTSENDISALPNYIFELSNSVEQNDGKAGRMMPMETNDPDSSNEIPTDDVDCSICLDLYENGSELKLLPCKHNFHAACIQEWLSIKRTCPLCKQELKCYLPV